MLLRQPFFLLREHFPGLPNELRDFQVESLACERLESLFCHKFTGRHRPMRHRRWWNLPHYGCSADRLRQISANVSDWPPHASWWIWTHKIYTTYVYFFSIGSTVIVVSALTAIAQQLLSDCHGYGIEALSSNQASEVNGNIFQVLLDNGFQDLALKGNFFRLNLRFWPNNHWTPICLWNWSNKIFL